MDDGKKKIGIPDFECELFYKFIRDSRQIERERAICSPCFGSFSGIVDASAIYERRYQF